VSENVKIEPATTPGKASGHSTVVNVLKGRAPKSAEARSKLAGTRSMAAWMGKTMKGSQM
jgi:hypothetical protein